MSSLADDCRSRLPIGRIDLPGYGTEAAPAAQKTVACRWCGHDEVPLNDLDECETCAPTEDETCEEHAARMRRQNQPFTVMATIHGPAGWFDVIDTKQGRTVAVCPRICFARRIARLLAQSCAGGVQ